MIINYLISISIIYFVFISQALSGVTESNNLITNNAQIKPILQSIQNIPKGKDLIRKATANGPIFFSIDCSSSMPFEAMWDAGKRRIVIDGTNKMCSGVMIRNVLFELHNAAADPQFDSLVHLACQGLIDCNNYVKETERIEHTNVLQTVALLNIGISQGTFPHCSQWEVIENFDAHYQIQQLSGHSQYLAEEFERFKPRSFKSQPYTGTIKGLNQMTERKKMDLVSNIYSRLPKNRK